MTLLGDTPDSDRLPADWRWTPLVKGLSESVIAVPYLPRDPWPSFPNEPLGWNLGVAVLNQAGAAFAANLQEWAPAAFSAQEQTRIIEVIDTWRGRGYVTGSVDGSRILAVTGIDLLGFQALKARQASSFPLAEAEVEPELAASAARSRQHSWAPAAIGGTVTRTQPSKLLSMFRRSTGRTAQPPTK